VFVYHFLYETGSSTVARIALERTGLVYKVDPWSGSTTTYAADVAADGRLVVSVPLEPGETAYFTVDHTGAVGGKPKTETVVETLDDWQIAVESWDAGEPQIISEDRGLGYVSREVRFATSVNELASSERSLKPWRVLAEVGPAVSGVGDYVTELVVSEELLGHGRLLLDLGSTAGGLGSVSVNGGAPLGFATSHPRVDITDHVTAGTNRIHVRTASSLNNRLLARGYYSRIPDVALELNGLAPDTQKTTPHDHGLLGPVRLVQVS